MRLTAPSIDFRFKRDLFILPRSYALFSSNEGFAEEYNLWKTIQCAAHAVGKCHGYMDSLFIFATDPIISRHVEPHIGSQCLGVNLSDGNLLDFLKQTVCLPHSLKVVAGPTFFRPPNPILKRITGLLNADSERDKLSYKSWRSSNCGFAEIVMPAMSERFEVKSLEDVDALSLEWGLVAFLAEEFLDSSAAIGRRIQVDRFRVDGGCSPSVCAFEAHCDQIFTACLDLIVDDRNMEILVVGRVEEACGYISQLLSSKLELDVSMIRGSQIEYAALLASGTSFLVLDVQDYPYVTAASLTSNPS